MKSTLKALFCIFLLFSSFLVFSQKLLAEKHYEGEDVKSVKVIGSFCDVTVTRGDQLIFDGLIKGDGDQGDYIIAVVASRDEVLFKVERKKSRNWGWNDIDVARLDLVVPQGVELDIENTSGNVRVTGIKSNFISIMATSGDLILKQLEGELRIKTTSGNLMLKDVVGKVSVRSTSGDQELFGISGDLMSQATSGNIEIDQMEGYLDVTTTSGDMDFDTITGGINATSTSGNIEGEYILLSGDSRFKSTSGDIQMEFKNDLNELGFDLRATSGDLEVGNLDGEDHLLIKRGEIQVTGISTSGNQTYSN